MATHPHADLTEEARHIWLEDPRQHPYLREGIFAFGFRVGLPKGCFPNPDRIKVVGYAELSLTAVKPTDAFFRRVWYLKLPNDPFDGSHSPGEAVKPSSIKLGKPSEEGRDSWG